MTEGCKKISVKMTLELVDGSRVRMRLFERKSIGGWERKCVWGWGRIVPMVEPPNKGAAEGFRWGGAGSLLVLMMRVTDDEEKTSYCSMYACIL